MSQILDVMIEAALAASKIALEIYNQPIAVFTKSDGSPVTIADEKAEQIIFEKLSLLGLPILAEESACAGNIPELGDRFFCVDPIDGTKEFIKKNGEFTVNIALIENGKPTCGVVIAPALNKGYAGGKQGAFSFDIVEGEMGQKTSIQTVKQEKIDWVSSRSHGNDLLLKLATKIELGENISVGSSLKFCMLASGKARLYPRFTNMCEWDSAAGQAVLEAAGGVVLTLDGKSLFYKKNTENFINPFIVCASDEKLGQKVAKIMAELIEGE